MYGTHAGDLVHIADDRAGLVHLVDHELSWLEGAVKVRCGRYGLPTDARRDRRTARHCRRCESRGAASRPHASVKAPARAAGTR